MELEEIIYNYIKREIERVRGNVAFHVPITGALIRTLVGQFGLDILEKSKLIAPTAYPDQYVLWCEP